MAHGTLTLVTGTDAREVRLARLWFASQGVAGLAWAAGVLLSETIRRATVGDLPPLAVLAPDVVLFSFGSLVAATGRAAAAVVVLAWTAVVTTALAGYGLVTGLAGWGVAVMAVATAGTLLATVVLVQGRLGSEWALVGPLRAGTAAEATVREHLIRSIRQLLVFWAFFLVVLPAVITWGEHRLGLGVDAFGRSWAPPVGVGLLVVGSLLGWRSMWVMATRGHGTPLPSAAAGRLVIAGPYRWVRNPMAVAGVLQAAGVGAIVGSWTVWVGVLAGASFWHWVIRPVEEADLRTRFGTAYEQYRRTVPLWRPRRPAGAG